MALVLVVGLALSTGCSTRVAPLPAAPVAADYLVGAPDELRINVLPEPEIEREVTVRPDGMISVDLIGDVQAATRTPLQIAQDIEERIGRYKRGATVNVTVVSSPSQFVTIYGEVSRPGTFSLDTETRVSEAIGRVGGTRPFASLNSVRVIRPTRAEPQIFEVALGDIQKGDLSTNIVVQEGDLIVVPPTVLARIGYTMQMIFFPFQPILGTAGTVGGVWFAYDRVSD
jgi:polysaccharide export outer membrane protein